MKCINWLWMASAMLVVMVCTGCATRVADLTAISTKNVKLDTVDLDTLPQTQGVTGKDTRFVFLFIPFGMPQLENAVDDALEQGGGDLMLDAVVTVRKWWFLVGQNTIEVEGAVANTRTGETQ
jgi:hypothetical protein